MAQIYILRYFSNLSSRFEQFIVIFMIAIFLIVPEFVIIGAMLNDDVIKDDPNYNAIRAGLYIEMSLNIIFCLLLFLRLRPAPMKMVIK